MVLNVQADAENGFREVEVDRVSRTLPTLGSERVTLENDCTGIPCLHNLTQELRRSRRLVHKTKNVEQHLGNGRAPCEYAGAARNRRSGA